MQQLVNNDDYIESDTGEREEWMIIADMKLQCDNGNKHSLNCPSDFYAQDRLKYTAQEIGDMPHWINMQKKGDNLRKETTPTRVNIKKNSMMPKGLLITLFKITLFLKTRNHY